MLKYVGKKQIAKRNSKISSIKKKILYLPLTIVLIGIILTATLTSYLSRESLLNEMRNNGIVILQGVIDRIEDNTKALVNINKLLEEQLRTASNIVVGMENNLSNDILVNLSQQLDVAEINWYNPEGRIIFSNIKEYIGWQALPGHPVHNFASSGKDFQVDEIARDAKSGKERKYGYKRGINGYFVQIGISGEKIEELTNLLNYQAVIEDLAKNEDIIYALFIDKNLRAVAHSNRGRVGIILNDEGSRTAAIDGQPYSIEHYYEEEKVYEILLPVYIDGEHIGAINLGFSMEKVYNTINKNILIFGIVGFLVFIFMGLILFLTSKGITKTINNIKENLVKISLGNLNITTDVKLLKRNDEIGQMAQAVNEMIKSMKYMIENIKEKSHHLNISSDSLVATSGQMSMSSQELASTMNQVAEGSSSQAQNLEAIVFYLSELTNNIEGVNIAIERVKEQTENTQKKANIGKIEMDILVKSMEEIKNTFQLVIKKVETLTNSIYEISSISELISNISEQTNLLALNAAIEAARAGEHGRGFAVVAEEVGKLAIESRKSTEKIIELVSSITKDTAEVVKTSKNVEQTVGDQVVTVEKTVKSFGDILEAVENIAPLIEQTYSAMEEIVRTKEVVIEKAEQVSAVTEETSAATEEVAASSQELSASSEELAITAQNLREMAKDLINSVDKFKL